MPLFCVVTDENERGNEFILPISKMKFYCSTKKYLSANWQNLLKYMNPESVGGFLGTVSKNLDDFADGELSKLMLSTATDCGISIAEGTFEALSGPAGVALKAMFAITSVTDILIEMNDGLDCLYQGSIRIKTV